MPILTEEEVDDVLYCARTNEVEELKTYIPTLFPKYGSQPAWILSQAADDQTGNSALHYASANGHIDMVKYLLSLFEPAAERKAYANRQNQSGNTALHWAALNGHMELAKLLLANGADASILNASGHDAVYEAEMNDKQDVAEYLLKEALGLEQAIGGEREGKEEEDEEMAEAESSAMAERVADGMAEMDLKSPVGKDDD